MIIRKDSQVLSDAVHQRFTVVKKLNIAAIDEIRIFDSTGVFGQQVLAHQEYKMLDLRGFVEDGIVSDVTVDGLENHSDMFNDMPHLQNQSDVLALGCASHP